MRLTIIIPTLDEAESIGGTLAALQPMRQRGVEVIVVDGGSADGTCAAVAPWSDRILTSAPGRARQMNAGAAASRADVLLFLHADTLLPAHADTRVVESLAASGRAWGWFDVAIDGRAFMLRVVATMMNLRARLTSVATGDQALFVTREAFEAVGQFPDQPLMEDIELSLRLRRRGPPTRVADRVLTSGRRWERDGVWRTIVLMWWLRLRYRLGASPDRLARRYAGSSPRS